MNRIFRSRQGTRAVVLTAILGSVVIVASCSDPLGLQTRYVNSNQPFTAYALSGVPLSAPSGMLFASRTIVRVDGAFAFDLAFDIDGAGSAVILPVGLVGTPISGAPLIGLQRSTTSYDKLTEAPKGGYFFDSTMAVRVGGTVVFQAQQGICSQFLAPYIFAKMTVDSVSLAKRAIYGHTLINTNCGSRQLTPGVPSF